MLSGEQVEGTSNADSCQAIATSQETIQTVTTYTTGTVATTQMCIRDRNERLESDKYPQDTCDRRRFKLAVVGNRSKVRYVCRLLFSRIPGRSRRAQ